jgi:hypothetical protein
MFATSGNQGIMKIRGAFWIELKEIDRNNLFDVIKLSMSDEQSEYVATFDPT